ncbi:hypothetical protein Tco_1334904 [Tanacetum coccineum]
MSSSSKSTHYFSRKLRRAILEPWRQSHNLPPSPPPNRNTPTSPSTTNSSPSLLPPQILSLNQITHELHHVSNLLEINLQQVIDAINPSPPTPPCIPPPSLDQYPKDSGFELTAFSDADHVRCIDTRKSTSGGIQFLGDKLVSWMSKKQDYTAMSSAEAETEYQVVDMFTKALPEDRFQYLVRRIGMRCLTPAELEVLTNESA